MSDESRTLSEDEISRQIGERLAKIRQDLNVTKTQMSRIISVSFRTYKDYESGVFSPKATGLAALAKHNVNIHWLVSGEGSQFVGEPALPETGSDVINDTLMVAAISIVDQLLSERGLSLPRDKKAKLITELYRWGVKDLALSKNKSKGIERHTAESFLKLVV